MSYQDELDPEILSFFVVGRYAIGGEGPCGKRRIYPRDIMSLGGHPIYVLYEEEIEKYERIASLIREEIEKSN